MTEHDNADEVTRLRAEVAEHLDELSARFDLICTLTNRAESAEAEVERLKRNTAGLYERTHAAEAAVAHVREALDIRTRARAWMTHLGYEDHQIDAAEAWRQPREPWLHDDPPTAVVDLETAVGIAREYDEAIRAALDPASPATRPSPAPADDEGTGTGAAPSEGHSEARGEKCSRGHELVWCPGCGDGLCACFNDGTCPWCKAL
jgi:hypothetical protein